MTTKAGFKDEIVRKMESLGIYRSEFDLAIDTLSDVMYNKQENRKQWKQKANLEMTISYTNRGGETNISKSPYYVNDLQYNEQILKYSKALGLTPTDAKKMGVTFEDDTDPLGEFQI